jgi:hypothetical protein
MEMGKWKEILVDIRMFVMIYVGCVLNGIKPMGSEMKAKYYGNLRNLYILYIELK